MNAWTRGRAMATGRLRPRGNPLTITRLGKIFPGG